MKNAPAFLGGAVVCTLFFSANPDYGPGKAFTCPGRLNGPSHPANGSYNPTFTLFPTNSICL
jgi:hypothetical protein